jgi:hypothetical protein
LAATTDAAAGEVTNTVVAPLSSTAALAAAASRLRFSPQFSSKEMATEMKTFFSSPDSPNTSSSSSSGSLDSSEATSSFPSKGPLPGEKGSFFKTFPSLENMW